MASVLSEWEVLLGEVRAGWLGTGPWTAEHLGGKGKVKVKNKWGGWEREWHFNYKY